MPDANIAPTPHTCFVTTLRPASEGTPHRAAPIQVARTVLSALVPASIAGSMKDEIFQAASNTLKNVAVRRRKWNLR